LHTRSSAVTGARLESTEAQAADLKARLVPFMDLEVVLKDEDSSFETVMPDRDNNKNCH
jgi:hypothetical protein